MRRGGGGGSDEVGQMATEARVDYQLFLAIGLSELDEQDLGGQVVDVGNAVGLEDLLQLVGDNLGRLRLGFGRF